MGVNRSNLHVYSGKTDLHNIGQVAKYFKGDD